MISSLELARICGVSQGTVDRALYNRKGISPATRERILEEARKHGYAPNPAVMEIMQGTSRFVGAILPAFKSVFFMDVLNDIQSALREIGLRLLLAPQQDLTEMREMAREFAARRCRGLVVIPAEEGIAFEESLVGSVPVISLLSAVYAKRSVFLAPDEVRTGTIAVDYFRQKGHHRIAHLTYKKRARAIDDRSRGYAQAMRSAGLEVNVATEQSARRIVSVVRKTQATALFCHNDWLAMHAIRALTHARIRVPEDVSILGVDNSPSLMDYHPDLTTLEYPRRDIASQVAALMGKWGKPGKIKDCKVIERGTVAEAVH